MEVDVNGRVNHLRLSRNQLSGSIPAELGNLANLEWLNLAHNQLSGPIPAELGNLANLQYLWLYSNELSGPIPPEFGSLSKLRFLALLINQLSGPIPAELGNLANLEYLSLAHNQLRGPIPAELGNLANLGRAVALLQPIERVDSGRVGQPRQPGIPESRSQPTSPDAFPTGCVKWRIMTSRHLGCPTAETAARNDPRSRRHGVRPAHGLLEPGCVRGGVTFLSSGGNVTLRFADGGYIEEGNYRFTCQSSGGCTIENRRVTAGTILQTAQGTAPGGGSVPDLVVESVTGSDDTPDAGASFTLRADGSQCGRW